MRVLFIDDCNMFEAKNPHACLVDVFNTSELIMKSLEKSQIGVYRRGGRWEEIMKDGKIEFNLISSGRKSNYKAEDYDLEYELISGNY
jgi:hypothetical protein